MSGNYVNSLKNIILKLEDDFNLNIVKDGVALSKLNIESLLEYYLELTNRGTISIDKVISSSIKELPTFLLCEQVLSFNTTLCLNLTPFYRLDIVYKCCDSLSTLNGCSKDIEYKLNLLLEICKKAEEDATIVSGLTYRTFRLLLLSISLSNQLVMTTLARFLNNQIILFYDLENKGNFVFDSPKEMNIFVE